RGVAAIQMEHVAAAIVAHEDVALVALGADIKRGVAAVQMEHVAAAIVAHEDVALIALGADIECGVAAIQMEHVDAGVVADENVALVALGADIDGCLGTVDMEYIDTAVVAREDIALIALGANAEYGILAVEMEDLEPTIVAHDDVALVALGADTEHGILAVEMEDVRTGVVLNENVAVTALGADAEGRRRCLERHDRTQRTADVAMHRNVPFGTVEDDGVFVALIANRDDARATFAAGGDRRRRACLEHQRKAVFAIDHLPDVDFSRAQQVDDTIAGAVGDVDARGAGCAGDGDRGSVGGIAQLDGAIHAAPAGTKPTVDAGQADGTGTTGILHEHPAVLAVAAGADGAGAAVQQHGRVAAAILDLDRAVKDFAHRFLPGLSRFARCRRTGTGSATRGAAGR